MGRLRSLNGRTVSATTMMVQRVAVQIPAILLALAIVAHTSEVSLDDTPLASMPAPGAYSPQDHAQSPPKHSIATRHHWLILAQVGIWSCCKVWTDANMLLRVLGS